MSPYSPCVESSPEMRLFEDHRAHRVGDVLTVKVVESVSSKKVAETKTSKSSSASGGVSSFLGLSIQPPTPDWGYDLYVGKAFARRYPWLIMAPGFMITLLAAGFALIGEGLSERLRRGAS